MIDTADIPGGQPAAPVLHGGLLLGQAVKRPQTPDELPAINRNDPTSGEKAFKY